MMFELSPHYIKKRWDIRWFIQTILHYIEKEQNVFVLSALKFIIFFLIGQGDYQQENFADHVKR